MASTLWELLSIKREKKYKLKREEEREQKKGEMLFDDRITMEIK